MKFTDKALILVLIILTGVTIFLVAVAVVDDMGYIHPDTNAVKQQSLETGICLNVNDGETMCVKEGMPNE